ncbi:MAG: DUF4287 domain-containing protein [Candidatus Leucobacter sulfamidivorax]|nr:DUF4287 domain-containing protein [Candidatus Leucobacter sulfamidivorax]
MDIDRAVETQLQNIERATGTSRAQWFERIRGQRAQGLTHGRLVGWLKSEHGLTHGNANLLVRLSAEDGDPDPSALVEQQYRGAKAGLRPIYESLVQFARSLGPDVVVDPKKTGVALRRNRVFAVITPAARDRIDLGLKLDDRAGGGRLEADGGMCTHRVRIASPDQFDDELRGWIGEAYGLAGLRG